MFLGTWKMIKVIFDFVLHKERFWTACFWARKIWFWKGKWKIPKGNTWHKGLLHCMDNSLVKDPCGRHVSLLSCFSHGNSYLARTWIFFVVQPILTLSSWTSSKFLEFFFSHKKSRATSKIGKIFLSSNRAKFWEFFKESWWNYSTNSATWSRLQGSILGFLPHSLPWIFYLCTS